MIVRIAAQTAGSSFDLGLVVQNVIQQWAVNFQATSVVVDEAKFSKFVHKEAHAGPGCSDHLRQSFLADLGDNGLRFAFLAEVRQQQKHSGKAFHAQLNK